MRCDATNPGGIRSRRGVKRCRHCANDCRREKRCRYCGEAKREKRGPSKKPKSADDNSIVPLRKRAPSKVSLLLSRRRKSTPTPPSAPEHQARRGRVRHNVAKEEVCEASLVETLRPYLKAKAVCKVVAEYVLVFSRITVFICPGGQLSKHRRSLLEGRMALNGALVLKSVDLEEFDRVIEGSRDLVLLTNHDSEERLLKSLIAPSSSSSSSSSSNIKGLSNTGRSKKIETWFVKNRRSFECHQVKWASLCVTTHKRLDHTVYSLVPLPPAVAPNATDAPPAGAADTATSSRSTLPISPYRSRGGAPPTEDLGSDVLSPSRWMERGDHHSSRRDPPRSPGLLQLTPERVSRLRSNTRWRTASARGPHSPDQGTEEEECSVLEHNTRIADQLMKLSKMYKANGDQRRVKVYSTAASAILAYPSKIASKKQARQVPGIGKSVAEKVDEILNTGTLQRLRHLSENEKWQVLNLFVAIHGIGASLAERLYRSGCRTLEDLKGHPLVSSNSALCLSLNDELSQEIPRSEAVAFAQRARAVAQEISCNLQMELCGSFRRGRERAGDIDLMFWDASLRPGERRELLGPLIRALKKDGLLTHILTGPAEERSCSSGKDNVEEDSKPRKLEAKPNRWGGVAIFPGEQTSSCCMAIGMLPKERGGLGIHRRVDVRVCHPSALPFQLLHFSSGKEFNQAIRTAAMNKGFSLSEHGLVPVRKVLGKSLRGNKREACGPPILCESERDIFKALDLAYVPVEKRDGIPHWMPYIRSRGKKTRKKK